MSKESDAPPPTHPLSSLREITVCWLDLSTVHPSNPTEQIVKRWWKCSSMHNFLINKKSRYK